MSAKPFYCDKRFDGFLNTIVRYFEISSGFRIPVSSEENEILDRTIAEPLAASDLDDRAGQVACEMVKRGLLHAITADGETYYEADKLDLWRF